MKTCLVTLLLLLPACLAGQSWTQETSAAAWAARSGHTTAVFNNRLWVLGGYTQGAYKSDVWSSADGVQWTQETAAAAWTPREQHTTAVFNNRLWVVGGGAGVMAAITDIWSSPDGVNWTMELAAAPWVAKRAHSMAVLNGRMWVMGGTDSSFNATNDVWSSVDGVNWTLETAAAQWYARTNHASVAHDNRLWVMAGLPHGNGGDVWSSADGITWTQATPLAPWIGRHDFASAVYDGRIWVMGGYGSGGATLNDVWSSSDGVTWTQEAAAAWGARWRHSATTFNNRVWVLGGFNAGQYKHDVWSRDESPQITSAASTVAVAGLPYSYVVTATAATAVSATGLPGWLGFDVATAELSGTPAASDIGLSGAITVTAVSSLGTDSQVFQVDVQGQPPQITSAPPGDAAVGSVWSYTVTASGIPAPALSVTVLPVWATFNPVTGQVSGIPALADVGTATMEVTASNGWGPIAVQTLNFEVHSNVSKGSSTAGGGCTAGVGSTPLYGMVALLALKLRRRRT